MRPMCLCSIIFRRRSSITVRVPKTPGFSGVLGTADQMRFGETSKTAKQHILGPTCIRTQQPPSKHSRRELIDQNMNTAAGFTRPKPPSHYLTQRCRLLAPMLREHDSKHPESLLILSWSPSSALALFFGAARDQCVRMARSASQAMGRNRPLMGPSPGFTT